MKKQKNIKDLTWKKVGLGYLVIIYTTEELFLEILIINKVRLYKSLYYIINGYDC